MEEVWGQVRGEECAASMPSVGASPSQDLDMFTSPEAFWTPSVYMFFFGGVGESSIT